MYLRSRDPTEELQPQRIIYASNIHLRVVGFHVKWDFVPVQMVDSFDHTLDSLLCCLLSRRNSVTTSAIIYATSSCSNSIL